jgi:hypothetical protein
VLRMQCVCNHTERHRVTASPGWASASLASIIFAVVARSTSNLLVGPTLCRNEDYIKLCIEYATEMESSAGKVRALFPFLRPILAPYYCRRMRDLRQIAKSYIGPLLSSTSPTPEEKKASYTAVGWLSDRLRGRPQETAERQIARILFLNVISIFTVSMASLNVLYDILARPDVKKALIQEVLELTEGKFGSSDTVPFDRLKKLDSCIRESQRLNPTNWSKSRFVILCLTLTAFVSQE